MLTPRLRRTHRERKEQYIRALESEISRLREAYSEDVTAANTQIQQQRDMVSTLKQENEHLKEILRSCGIPFEAEFERRKAEYEHRRVNAFPADSYTGGASSTTGSQSAGLQSSNAAFLTTPPSSFSPPTPGSREGSRGNGSVPFQTHGVHSSPIDHHGTLDFSNQANGSLDPVKPLPAVPGIFEEDPQLGIEFILTCVFFFSFFAFSRKVNRANWRQTRRAMSSSHRISLSRVGERCRERLVRLWSCPHGVLSAAEPYR